MASRALSELADPRIRESCSFKMWPMSIQWSARHESDVPWAISLFCVGSIRPRTRDLVDDFSSLQSWDGVINVNQVGSQWRMGLVDMLVWDAIDIE